jgi:putative ABC transport system permease protein
MPLTDEEIAEDDTDFHVKIAIRVNPSADHDFPEFFVKQMEKQLSIDRLYLLDVIPYSDLRYSMELRNGVKSELQNQIAVMGFLLFNIFLGIIGTFWFRTEQRKGEMGLRIALGSTRFSLKGIMIAEGVLLLTLIAIPALLICFNLHVSELTKGFYMDYTIARFVEGFFITYLVMAVMIILGIWYPAHQMVRLEPADALRYE